MTDPDAAATAAYTDTIAAGMRGLNDHFHAIHDDEDSVEECCVAAVIEAAGFADTFDACQQATARERQRIREARIRVSPDDDGTFSINGRRYYYIPADLLDGDGDG